MAAAVKAVTATFASTRSSSTNTQSIPAARFVGRTRSPFSAVARAPTPRGLAEDEDLPANIHRVCQELGVTATGRDCPTSCVSPSTIRTAACSGSVADVRDGRERRGEVGEEFGIDRVESCHGSTSEWRGGDGSVIDACHGGVVVSCTGCGCEVVESFQLGGGEFDAVGGGVLFDAGDTAGAGDRGDVVAASEDPCQGGLCWCGSDFGADGADLDSPWDPRRLLTLETRMESWHHKTSRRRVGTSTMARLRRKFSPVKRGLVLRQSSSAKSSTVWICPVSSPWPSGE